MNYLTKQIVFREIPNEISLSYLITGCPLRCSGCHSADSWNPAAGGRLTMEHFLRDLKTYEGWITCVLFLGGEWYPKELQERLQMAQNLGLKTALYTGLDQIDSSIVAHLNFLKTGPYQKDRGGLDQARSNQKLVNVLTGEVLNSLFTLNKEELNDSIK